MKNGRLIIRHAIVSLVSLLLFIALNHSSVLLISRLGSVTWYPATGFGWLLPGNQSLVCRAGLRHRSHPRGTVLSPALLFLGQTVGDLGFAMCYGVAAYVLRGPLRIDLGLRRRRDVVRYVFVSVVAAVAATAIGVSCLAADKIIQWSDVWRSAWMWFAGDGIGLLGVAPFFLIHVFPWVRKIASPSGRHHQENDASANRKVESRVLYIAGKLSPRCRYSYNSLGHVWRSPGFPTAVFPKLFPIIWIAMRQGIRRAVSGLLAINFGIVVAMHLFPPGTVFPLRSAC